VQCVRVGDSSGPVYASVSVMFSLLLSGMAGGIFQSRLKEKVVRGAQVLAMRAERIRNGAECS